jgi:hypothetical protein
MPTVKLFETFRAHRRMLKARQRAQTIDSKARTSLDHLLALVPLFARRPVARRRLEALMTDLLQEPPVPAPPTSAAHPPALPRLDPDATRPDPGAMPLDPTVRAAAQYLVNFVQVYAYREPALVQRVAELAQVLAEAATKSHAGRLGLLLAIWLPLQAG